MKLTEEDKDTLENIYASGQWPAVVKLVSQVIKNQETAVLKCTVQETSRAITLKRAELEGGRAVLTAVQNIKTFIK